jgi:predicted esterase
MDDLNTEACPSPHGGERVLVQGERLDKAKAVVLCVHGRGASPEDILPVGHALRTAGLSFVAPAASGSTWYPLSFMSETERNQPGLDSALAVLASLVQQIESHGIPSEKIMLLGFSQGACLSSEFAVRHARRFGGLVAFSGGLVGPPGTVWEYPGDFAGTPIFMGCSDVDPHIPVARLDESEVVFGGMGADVTKRIYSGMGHTINEDELRFAQGMARGIVG